MAGSSSTSPVDSFSGEGFQDWSKLMKERLISEGLWVCVTEEFTKPNQTEDMMSATEIKQAKMNDIKALSLIHESLSPTAFMSICHATTAKQAWDTLHSMFQAQLKMKEKEDELTKESSGEFVMSSGPSDEDRVMPLSGKKPFFDMVLTKSALKPRYHMNFPNRVDGLLPSSNMIAKVKFFGKIYEMYFYGTRKQKSLGAGWRQLLEEHDLNEGDFVVFEIMESTDSKLEMNMQILKPHIPPELEQEMRKRGIQTNPTIVNVVEDDDVE